MQIRSDGRSVDELLIGRDLSQPVGMLNLLKFRSHARYADDSDVPPCSGVEAYQRYGDVVGPLVADMGGGMIMTAMAELIGPPGEWDSAFIVRYPSGLQFLAMLDSPVYRSAVHHRTAALADSRLLMLAFNAELEW